jgi:hypothetical protein
LILDPRILKWQLISVSAIEKAVVFRNELLMALEEIVHFIINLRDVVMQIRTR